MDGQIFDLPTRTITVKGHTIGFDGTTITVDGQSYTVEGRTVLVLQARHEYQSFSLNDLIASASDTCELGLNLSRAVITQVASDEPEDMSGIRDGNTLNDIVIASDCKSVQLRSERDLLGNGRVYTISLKVRDASGNQAQKSANVIVPKLLSGGQATDDGPLYVVSSACN